MASNKPMSIEEFYKKIDKEDKNTIVNLDKREPIDYIPTGSWVIDKLVGDGTMTGKPGGYPRGHIVEIFGDESSGKTTLAMSAIKMAQKKGGLGVLLDFEQTFHRDYAAKLGIDLDSKKFIIAQPNHFQQGARLIKDTLLLRPAIIVVDSVSAMVPQQLLEGAVDEAARIGLQAQLMSAFLGYISKSLKNSNTCLLFLNQIRSVIKKSKYDVGPDEESSGGKALKFYSSLRLKLKKSTVETLDVKSSITGAKGKEPVNITIKVTVAKNKIDKPYYTAPVYIRFGDGIDNIRSVIELAINTKVIKKSGSFYTFSQGEETIVKSQGKEQLWQILNENEKAFDLLKGSLQVNEDKQTKEIYEQVEDTPNDDMDDLLSNVAENFIGKQAAKKEDEEIQ